jgi:hypothetical protein
MSQVCPACSGDRTIFKWGMVVLAIVAAWSIFLYLAYSGRLARATP